MKIDTRYVQERCRVSLAERDIVSKRQGVYLIEQDGDKHFGFYISPKNFGGNLVDATVFFFVVWKPFEDLMAKGFQSRHTLGSQFTQARLGFKEGGFIFASDVDNKSVADRLATFIQTNRDTYFEKLSSLIEDRRTFTQGNTNGVGYPEKVIVFDYLTSGIVKAKETYAIEVAKMKAPLDERLKGFWRIISEADGQS